jgi:hypothetical protein
MPYIVGILPRPIYTFQSDVHVRPRHIENTDPRFRTKTKFKPGEGGQAFDDEIYQHPNVIAYQQLHDQRYVYEVDDLGRITGAQHTAIRSKIMVGGKVVIDSNTGEVVTHYPI